MDDAELTRLRHAVQVDPTNMTARLALLEQLIAASRWEEAEEAGAVLLQEAIPLAATHVLMGVAYGKQQRWEEAINQCRQALVLEPEQALALFNLGTLLARQGDMDAAVESLEKVVAQQAEWAEAHYTLGTVFLRQGRYVEAIRTFDRAVEQRATYPEAHFNRGNAHAMKGLDPDGRLEYYELDRAIEAYKMAIQQRPGYTAALYNLAMLYKHMASAEGLRVWEQYLEAARDLSEEEIWRVRAQEYKRDLEDRLR